MKRSVAGVLATLALLLAPLPLAARTAATAGQRAFGNAVTPRSFAFSSLPPRVEGVLGVVNVHRPEGIDPQTEARIERQKAHPHGLTPAQLGHVTIDRNPGPGRFGAGFEPGPLAPVLNNGFDGISQAGFIPSEPTVAAGPLNIFTAGNVSVTVTNKDGTSRVETAGTTFFGVTAGEGAISDAQCYYDALRGRFLALAFTTGTSPSNYSSFYLAISKTNDARGQWWLYKFDMTKDGNTPTLNWGDYEALGVSDDKIAMTAQMFGFGGNAYHYQKVRVLDRAAAYSGAALPYVDLFNFGPPPGGDNGDVFVTKAARNLTAGDNTIHLFCVRTAGGGNVTYRTVTGSPLAPVLSIGVRVTVSGYGAPPDAAQKGSSVLVPTNDCRPTDFYVRDGVLICAWHTLIELGGQVSAIRLFRMRTSDQAVLTDETYAASGTFLYYPAVTVDSVGTIFLGFDRSSTAEYPSAYVTGRRRGEFSLQASALVKAGLAPTSQSRWGDYTGIDNDAAASGPGGAVAWYAGQYTKGTNNFGTWINKLTFPYGQVSGVLAEDCDGSAATTSDRTPIAGVALALRQGASTLATTTSDAGGNYSFGYLESGTYDVVVTPPAGGAAVDASAGSGGTSQVRVSATDLQVTLTNTQVSTGNAFVVARAHAVPTTTLISPSSRSAGSPGFPMSVSGSGFLPCSIVRLDGSDRATTFVSASQLTVSVTGSDLVSPGSHSITVFSPAPGGGTSNAQTLSVGGAADAQAPVVSVTSPVGGESWAVGSSHAITWTASDNVEVSSVDLALSTNGGASFPDTIASGLANSGSYAWLVPAKLSATARVRVRARDAWGNVGADSSHANFTLAGWTVAASAGAGGTISPAGSIAVADGATPTFILAANAGYVLTSLLVNGAPVTPGDYTFAPIHANQTIAASFSPATYTLGITLAGSGSVAKVPDQASYASGTSVTLTATPAANWSFEGWSGDANSTVNPIGVTVDANKSITATFSQHVYTWNATGTASWLTAGNWTPSRGSPAADDVLVFNGGGPVTVTDVPTQTIRRLVLSNGTTVALQPATPATLTLTGGPGNDLDVPAASTLVLDGSSALTIALATGATGLVTGTVSVSNAGQRLTAVDAGAIVFGTDATMLVGTAFSGNVFGNASGTSGLNSVVFQNHSLYAQSAGGNPFGASVPSSVVVFQAGSRYRLDAPLVVSFSGRTFADFELNAPGPVTATGGTGFTADSIIVSQGTLNLNLTGGGTIRGNVTIRPGGALAFSPPSGTPTFMLGGATPQALNVQGILSTTPNVTIAVNNAAGVTMQSNATLAGTLAFTSGTIATGPYSLAIPASGAVTGAAPGTGWVAGRLRRAIAAGTSSRTFDVGAAAYTPVTLAMTGAASGFDLTVGINTPDHPGLATSLIDGAKSVNRWWTLAPVDPPAFTSYAATFTFAAADVDAGATPANFVIKRYASGWFPTMVVGRTPTSTQAAGLTAFGDFAIGERSSAPDTTSPFVALQSPNDGNLLLIGTHALVTWYADDDADIPAIDVLLSRSGPAGSFESLASGLANTGTYDWTVAGPASSNAFVKVVAHDPTGHLGSDLSDHPVVIGTTTAAEDVPVTELALAPVFPNPTSGAGNTRFSLPRAARVHLAVLDVQGREVRVLADGAYEAGRYAQPLDANARGPLGPGLYFLRLRAGASTLTRRFVVTR